MSDAGTNQAVSGPPVLLAAWAQWRGAVDCAHTGRIWSAEELRQLSSEAAARFVALGIEPGLPVALILANTAAFPVCLMALLEARCNVILTFAGTLPATLQRMTTEFGVNRLVHDYVAGVGKLQRQSYREIGCFPVGSLPISVLEMEPASTPSSVSIPANGVILHPTSGTYGAARYCVRNQTAAIAEANAYLRTIRNYDKARVTVTTPMTHAYAYGFGLVSAIVSHSTLAIDVSFNPKQILINENKRPSNILALVPPMFRVLVDIGRSDTDSEVSADVFYAGAPLNAPVATEFNERFGTRIFSILGTTETGAISTSYSVDGSLAGVGRPLDAVKIAIASQEHYQDLGDGVGEIEVSSPSMMQGYVPGLDAGSDAVSVFPTGDLGHVDEDGSLHLVGRIRDIINVGGMKVDPAEVEAVLIAHPSVEAAAVYPGLRSDGTEFVQAAIVSDAADTDVFKRHCLDQLDGYKVPSAFHIVDRLPLTPSGKCLKVQCPNYPESMPTVGPGRLGGEIGSPPKNRVPKTPRVQQEV